MFYVRSWSGYFKILYSIIKRIMVFVMNYFFAIQGPSKMLHHQHSRLRYNLPLVGNVIPTQFWSGSFFYTFVSRGSPKAYRALSLLHFLIKTKFFKKIADVSPSAAKFAPNLFAWLFGNYVFLEKKLGCNYHVYFIAKEIISYNGAWKSVTLT